MALVLNDPGRASLDATAEKGGVERQPDVTAPQEETSPFEVNEHPLLPHEELTPLNPNQTVFADRGRRRVYLRTRVALREGLLEMLLCKAQTKEHESILAIDADAFIIHAGLLMVGAETGTPVRFFPEFEPPTGQRIDVFVLWVDEEGQPQRSPAQAWVRHVTRRYHERPLDTWPAGLELPDDLEVGYDEQNHLVLWFGTMSDAQRDRLLELSEDPQWQSAMRSIHLASQPREMQAHWVFAGSGFYTDEEGRNWYQAEGGNVICVANFSDAMLDVAVESTASGEGLLFEPYTERIPELGTEVILELVPVFEKSEVEEEPAGDSDGSDDT